MTTLEHIECDIEGHEYKTFMGKTFCERCGLQGDDPPLEGRERRLRLVWVQSEGSTDAAGAHRGTVHLSKLYVSSEETGKLADGRLWWSARADFP